MANTAVHETIMTKDAVNAPPAGTAIVAGNNHVITPSRRASTGFLRISHTTHAEKTLVVKAGDRPPAAAAGQGDLTLTLEDATAADKVYMVPLTVSRFLKANGTFVVTVAAATTGTLEWIELPRP